MHTVLQRPLWNGPPERSPDSFHVTKETRVRAIAAPRELWTHPFGWEPRLQIAGHALQLSSVVCSAPEMVETVDQWKAAMIEKGWT